MFEKISAAPPDAIIGLTEAFDKDPNPDKINLGAGVYRDEDGMTPILNAVKTAERTLLEQEKTKEYLPTAGLPEYGRLVQRLLFGEEHEIVTSGRACTVHTPGGTAALRVGADFLKTFAPEAKIWISNPTWLNHPGIFKAAGFTVEEYPYYDAVTMGLDFDRVRAALSKIPAGDVVLLHAYCHNPTGVDPAPEQWDEISAIAREQRWIPFLDFAYQGFGEGLEADRVGLHALASAVPELVVASSLSKNFGLYYERTGALTLVASSTEAAANALSQIKSIIRVNYSSPPAHGEHVVMAILRDPALRAQWEDEVAQMRGRIRSMRAAFVEGLKKRDVSQEFSFINEQHGIFSFSGLTDEQVRFLRKQKSIYVVKGGRINVAGITTKNIDYLCDSIAAALRQ